MRRLFAALDVDYDQWKALTVTALKLDVRVAGSAVARVNQQRRSGARALAGQVLFYGLLGLFMAAAVVALNDRFAAAMIVLSYIVVVVATTMLADLYAVILSPAEYGILGFRPITPRTYFAAKLTNVLVYTLGLTTLVGLPPALAFIVKHGVAVSLAAVVAIYACAISVTLAIISGYAALVRSVGTRRLRNLLSWAQLGISFLVYGGYFAVSDLIGESGLAGFTLPWSPWLLFYPGTWFASYVELAAGRPAALHMLGVLTSAALLALLAADARRRLSLEYIERLGELTTDTAAPSRAPGRRWGLWFRRGEARAVAILVRSHFRNDLKFRMGVLAILPLTVIYLLLGLRNARDRAGAIPDLSLVTFAILLFPTMLKTNLSRSDAFRASWIFFATPADRTRLIQASRNLLVTLFLIPYLIVLGIVLAFLTDRPAWLLTYLLLSGLLSNLVLLIVTLIDPELPFARPFQKQERTAQILVVMLAIGIVGAFAPFLLEWLYGHGSLAAVAAVFGALVALSLGVGRLTRARVERQAARLEFKG